MMRKMILGIVIGGFLVLGVMDILKGNFRLGIISLLLGTVNGLVLGGE